MKKREEAQTFSAHYSFSSITPAWATDRPTCSPTRAPACEAAAAWGPSASSAAPTTSAPSPRRTPARGHRSPELADSSTWSSTSRTPTNSRRSRAIATARTSRSPALGYYALAYKDRAPVPSRHQRQTTVSSLHRREY
jgi:hypothetical protein